jgi:hypothetical protein
MASLGAIICPEASAQDGPRASLTSRSWAWAIELLPGAGARPPAARSGLESGAILTI